MEIRSRFLNADVEVDKVYPENGRLIVEGVVKGLIPMRIGIDPVDAVRFALRSFNAPTLAFFATLPAALAREVVSDVSARLGEIASFLRTTPQNCGPVRR